MVERNPCCVLVALVAAGQPVLAHIEARTVWETVSNARALTWSAGGRRAPCRSRTDAAWGGEH